MRSVPPIARQVRSVSSTDRQVEATTSGTSAPLACAMQSIALPFGCRPNHCPVLQRIACTACAWNSKQALVRAEARQPEKWRCAPSPNNRTVLQQHVDFFDRDNDGIITVWDTYVGFRRIGFGRIISFLAMPFIHGTFSYPSQNSWLPDPFFTINTDNMHRSVHFSKVPCLPPDTYMLVRLCGVRLLPIQCSVIFQRQPTRAARKLDLGSRKSCTLARCCRTKHGSDSETYDTEGRYVPQKFEEFFSKCDSLATLPYCAQHRVYRALRTRPWLCSGHRCAWPAQTPDRWHQCILC